MIVVKNPPSVTMQSEYTDAQPYGINRNVNYYIAAAWGESDVQGGQVPDMLLVGDQTSTTANGVVYTNGPLESNTRYSLFIQYNIDSDVSDKPLHTFSSIISSMTGKFYLCYSSII